MRLRAVEPEDADFLWTCESEPSAEEYSLGEGPLSRDLLRRYAFSYMADPVGTGELRLIIETDRPVGIVDLYNFDVVNGRAFVGIYVLPAERRKGVATEAIGKLRDLALKRWNVQHLWAVVDVKNIASQRTFSRAGFRQVAELEGWLRDGDSSHSALLMTL